MATTFTKRRALHAAAVQGVLSLASEDEGSSDAVKWVSRLEAAAERV